MPRLQTYRDRPVVLLTNDDGPPCASSPNIFSFCKLLQSRLGWDVRVVIPDTQKSWVGKAYAISDVISASYFYPLEPEGLTGEVTTRPRPLKEGETMEWVLLSGTPATCTNIALHNLYPGEIDLVVSGPNHGRNSSTAFALSSGTLGAALAGALSTPIPGPSSGAASLHIEHIPCIAVSYGVVTRPVTARVMELATDAAVDVCERLSEDWGYDEDHEKGRHLVQVYSVNIPLVEGDLEKDRRQTAWTNMWRNAYGRLFKATTLTQAEYDPGDNHNQQKSSSSSSPAENQPQNNQIPPSASTTSTAGPGASPTPAPNKTTPSSPRTEPASDGQLRFHFAPDMRPLLSPPLDSLPVGSDAWAFAKGYISVTPLRAQFAGLIEGGYGFGSEEKEGKVAGSLW
ncbi:5'/3'-nucleotidase SurE [Kwoniella dejecticola CBS 10117]|uniref:5'/3'-nucleotidase SurE n=1 Tax=Kwoniella dejecticola CBS 10117 TaxID=1296121 RepID=A0A1A6A5P9_9TREE|nr:5'/3'-nucleotidase SurE [Kwoniella dejecticola CBS 10117]OBR85381.1 5'/3'-nucleotidase SurE [Kwoniella dejecticola CBS 10117]